MAVRRRGLVVPMPMLGRLLDGQFGGRVDVWPVVGDREPALQGLAVGAVVDPLLCTGESGQPLLEAALDCDVDGFMLQRLCCVDVTVAGVPFGRTVVQLGLRCGSQQVMDSFSFCCDELLGSFQVHRCLLWDVSKVAGDRTALVSCGSTVQSVVCGRAGRSSSVASVGGQVAVDTATHVVACLD